MSVKFGLWTFHQLSKRRRNFDFTYHSQSAVMFSGRCSPNFRCQGAT